MAKSIDNQDGVTVINIITVQPGKQETVATLQLEAVEKVKQGWPGFVSQQTLSSTDGTKVATIERWRTQEDLLAIVKDPSLLEYRSKIQQYAELAPAMYKVIGDSQS